MDKISIIGLGKLGCSMAVAFASRGFSTIGLDINKKSVDKINDGISPVEEKGVQDLLKKNLSRISATTSYQYAINNTDTSFVVVPTPSDKKGAFSLNYAKNAFEQIAKCLKNKKKYHLIVLSSTVLPGSLRYSLIPILEKYSNKKCGKDFGVSYNPEFIALGSVLRDFLNPDFILIGEYDQKSGKKLKKILMKTAMNKPIATNMSIENSELAKISVNSFVTMKISFANMLAEYCGKIPNGNVDVVSNAIGLDTRIGNKYLKGGLAFGGPCFPRDNVALSYLGRKLNVDTRLIDANHEYNENFLNKSFKILAAKINKNKKIAILGLSYKVDTSVLDVSPGFILAQKFTKNGYKVLCHENNIDEKNQFIKNNKLKIYSDLKEILKIADVIIVTKNEKNYQNINFKNLKELNNRKKVILVDYWRIYSEKKLDKNITYKPNGKDYQNEINAKILKKFVSHI
jgi:UDPglucose 6-dehydrogenase